MAKKPKGALGGLPAGICHRRVFAGGARQPQRCAVHAGTGRWAGVLPVSYTHLFLLLVIFTGYLIIYNIFQISVAGDIRFYGLLKTIGTTPRQLKRIIRQ